jgi:hypothetical protein
MGPQKVWKERVSTMISPGEDKDDGGLQKQTRSVDHCYLKSTFGRPPISFQDTPLPSLLKVPLSRHSDPNCW